MHTHSHSSRQQKLLLGLKLTTYAGCRDILLGIMLAGHLAERMHLGRKLVSKCHNLAKSLEEGFGHERGLWSHYGHICLSYRFALLTLSPGRANGNEWDGMVGKDTLGCH